jgi:hypothetical protein
MSREARDVILKPVVSEKSYASYDEKRYTFVVAPAPTDREDQAGDRVDLQRAGHDT